jgi:hypothetical protein
MIHSHGEDYARKPPLFPEKQTGMEKPAQEEIRDKFSGLNSRYNDKARVLFDYDFGC